VIFRRYWTVYLVFLHVLIMSVLALLFWQEYRPWIVAAELFLATTLAVGLWITFQHSRYDNLTEIGSDFIRERDFSHLFAESAHPDINRFITLYNRMIVTLREERLLKLEQEKLLDRVIDSTPSGLITLDSERVIEIINPAALGLLELPKEAVDGKRLDQLESEFAKRLAKLSVNQSEVYSLPGPRKVRVEHVHYFRESAQRSLYILTEMTHELWESERRVYEQVIRTFSHEVNNTVGATNSILQSVQEYAGQLGGEDRGDYVEALNVVVERMDSLNTFMRSYTDIVKLPTPVRVPVDLNERLKSIHSLFLLECGERNITFDLSVDEKTPRVMLDADQFERALINVLRNAVESVENGGRIILRLNRRPGGAIVVVVEDNGPGIDAEIQAELFTPFATSKTAGQGLGLVLVKEILTRHKMAFSLKTDSDGWTRFEMRIPANAIAL